MGAETVISVICCYNKPCEYTLLQESLRCQDIPCEMMGVNNTDHSFTSAAAALNRGAETASGDTLVFVHQDVRFLRPDSLRKLTAALRLCENKPCVAGPYGASRYPGRIAEYTLQDTLDECCVAMTRKTWEKFRFDQVFCDGWHLYAVELCIRVRQAGGMILSGDFGIAHTSAGTVDTAYMQTYKKLLLCCRSEKWLCTTCKSMPTNPTYFHAYYVLWKIKKKLLGNYNLSYNLKRMLKKLR